MIASSAKLNHNSILEGMKAGIINKMFKHMAESPGKPRATSPKKSPLKVGMATTGYEKLAQVLSDEPRHETAETLKLALLRKKKVA